MYKKDIYSINYELLKKKNIKLIAFDLDNTICKVDEKKPCKKVIQLINDLNKNFKVIIISNNSKKRVGTFCKELKCDYIHGALKPLKRTANILKKKYGNLNEACIVGDQIPTDIFMGNRSGMLTVLVDPISEKDLKVTFFNRLIEKRIMKKINFKKGEYYEKE